MKNKNTKTIILAAGEGTRLMPYTSDRPKCMVEIDGRSLIDRQLEILKNNGISEIIIIGGYKATMLKMKSNKLLINDIYNKSNMLWTLFCAENELHDEVIVSYGDIVYSSNVLQRLINSNEDISVIIDLDWEEYWKERNDNPLDDAETLKVNNEGYICEIGKKPQSISEIEGQYIGLMKFSKRGILKLKSLFHSEKEGITNFLGKPVKNAYMTDFLQALIDSGERVSPIFINSGWIEIDTVNDLKSSISSERLKLIT